MVGVKNKGGRPVLTEKQKAEKQQMMLLKLEPYLKSGLSVNKSLQQANIANSEFYRMRHKNDGFWERIEQYKNYISILFNSTIVKHLHYIVQKQNQGSELTDVDVKFLFWFGLNANVCREEWGRHEHVSLFDPEEELQKMKKLIDEKI